MKMPVLFVGHGSPENVIWENSFSYVLKNLHSSIPRPKHILVISAHWETQGIHITANPETEIKYDFFGFPAPLYSVKYPVQLDQDMLGRVSDLLKDHSPKRDFEHGFDHGVWTVLYHLYPKADIPIIQISLPIKFSFEEHFAIGKELASLRNEGVLIVGSGNVVHNLRKLANPGAEPYSWAREFDTKIKEALLKKNCEALIHWDSALRDLGVSAHPSTDHYLPLLYCLGATDSSDRVTFPYEGFQYGSISMRTVFWN